MTFPQIIFLISVIVFTKGDTKLEKSGCSCLKPSVRFHLFNDCRNPGVDRELSEGIIPERDTLIENAPINFVIHGFRNNISSPMVQNIKNAYLKSGEVNVIAVDWGQWAFDDMWTINLNDIFSTKFSPVYGTSMSRIPDVACIVTYFIKFMVEKKVIGCDQIHIVGHSLGARISAEVARLLKQEKICNIRQITLLDPAGWDFDKQHPQNLPAPRIQPDSAECVLVVYSDTSKYGTAITNSGSYNIILNGGRTLGCFLTWTFDFDGCNHALAHKFFAMSIMRTDDFCDGYKAITTNCFQPTRQETSCQLASPPKMDQLPVTNSIRLSKNIMVEEKILSRECGQSFKGGNNRLSQRQARKKEEDRWNMDYFLNWAEGL